MVAIGLTYSHSQSKILVRLEGLRVWRSGNLSMFLLPVLSNLLLNCAFVTAFIIISKQTEMCQIVITCFCCEYGVVSS